MDTTLAQLINDLIAANQENARLNQEVERLTKENDELKAKEADAQTRA